LRLKNPLDNETLQERILSKTKPLLLEKSAREVIGESNISQPASQGFSSIKKFL
jgi:hypothetical protein